jgi:hypothetical protein
VIGGRSFDRSSRVHDARANMHVFGVVEGEDDLILMGMVKDVTDNFTNRYMAGLLGVIESLNQDATGKPLPPERRLLRITPLVALREPKRFATASRRLLGKGSFWQLLGWVAGNALLELLRVPFLSCRRRGCRDTRCCRLACAATRALPRRGCAGCGGPGSASTCSSSSN